MQHGHHLRQQPPFKFKRVKFMAPSALVLDGLNTHKVDTSDPALQADPNFPPDKEGTWKYPAELDGWIRAHNSIRAELDKMLKVLRHLGDRELKSWEATAIKEWWAGHEEHIHGHHSNEDDVLNPFLRKRIVYPDKLEHDHDFLVKCMYAISGIVNNITNAAELLPKWKEYRNFLFPHLHEEEQVGLPLVRAYFTPEEFAPCIQSIMTKASPIELGSFFHHIGGKKEIMEFMKQEGIPFFVWYLQFKGTRTLYREKMESKVEALLSGVEPSKKAVTHKKDLQHAMSIIRDFELFSPPSSPMAMAC